MHYYSLPLCPLFPPFPLMASPPFTSCNYKFNVFASFHGPDVRKTLLSHMHEQFKRNGITMFNDQEIERSATIAPSITDAIRESRISVVILSKKYASSSWCLDELMEILECRKAMGQIVMTIFYGVEPSDVQKQTGKFGIAFNESCEPKTDEERQKWSRALNDVGNIAGEDFLRWDNEAKMIEKIARDVSNKLNATPSREFDGMVGLEAHLREMKSMLDLDFDGVKMVGITGPAGIGKTTIARALQSQLSHKFQLTCFVDNLKGGYLSGPDVLRLQEQFLSKVFNQDGIRICHSGVIEERLHDLKVLIILDDVNNIKQLEALANETTWFGPGSRIVVTTENKEILQQYCIDNTYHMEFPSDEQALKILCKYAFKKSYPHDGFEKLAQTIIWLCGKLPLGLRVVGSSLRGKKKDEWEYVTSRLNTILDRDIEDVLRVGYESLDENEQTLFLHIAVFFNGEDGDLVKAMFADSDLDGKHGLKILVNRSLIEISTTREIIEMHKLLRLVAKNVIHSQKPWERRILMDAGEISDVLEHAKGTRIVSGISFDISDIDELSINEKTFKRMANLRFLRVYQSKKDRNEIMYIPDGLEFPRRLRLLHWEEYPSKCLPPKFHLEYLVKLNFPGSKLEKLWEGIQPLKNLKEMSLSGSRQLKELPNLSNGTNLVSLNLNDCESLVEIPSSCSHLQKLQYLTMDDCINLQVIPADMNLACLGYAKFRDCSKLRNIPVISTNIQILDISGTAAEDLPAVRLCSRLVTLSIENGKLKRITHLPTSLTTLDVSNTDIERIHDCLKDLHRLDISGCRRLASLPELPRSLRLLYAHGCESLETVTFPLNMSDADLSFINCFKLSQQARRAIIQHPFSRGTAILPGRQVPVEFDQRGRGNSLTIRPDGKPYSRFVVCLVISSKHQKVNFTSSLLCRRIGVSPDETNVNVLACEFRTEHLFIFDSSYLKFDPAFDMSREIELEFSSYHRSFEVVECGAAKIFTNESIEGQAVEDRTNGAVLCESKEDENLGDPTNLDDEKRTDCWSWIFLCFDLSHFVRRV